jgi:hypothetical protein
MELVQCRSAAKAKLLAAPVQFAGAADGASQPTRVKIGTLSHHENGCSDSWHNVVIEIPNADGLDLDYKGGPVAGVEIREVEANNGQSIGNIAFVAPNKISISLWAKGSGTRVNNPFNGGSVRVGGGGASEGVEIYAHYKAT